VEAVLIVKVIGFVVPTKETMLEGKLLVLWVIKPQAPPKSSVNIPMLIIYGPVPET